MKTTFFLILICLAFILPPNTFAQGNAEPQLPEGVKTYIKSSGKITGNMQYSPDGKELAVASDMGIWLYDARSGAEVALLLGHEGQVKAITYSPDGKMLASAGIDKTIRLWNPKTSEHLATLTGHSGVVRSIAFSPDGKQLVSGSWDGTTRLWATENRQQLWSAHTPQAQEQDPLVREFLGLSPGPYKNPAERLMLKWILAVAYSPDGKTVASSGNSGNTIHLWNIENGKRLRTLEGHTDMVNALTFSPDGKTLVSGSDDDTLRVWNAGTGRLRRTLAGHRNDVKAVVFSRDGKMLASGSKDASVRLWDAETGRFLPTLRGHVWEIEAVAFSPDGKTVASADDDTILFWDWKKLVKTQR